MPLRSRGRRLVRSSQTICDCAGACVCACVPIRRHRMVRCTRRLRPSAGQVRDVTSCSQSLQRKKSQCAAGQERVGEAHSAPTCAGLGRHDSLCQLQLTVTCNMIPMLPHTRLRPSFGSRAQCGRYLASSVLSKAKLCDLRCLQTFSGSFQPRAEDNTGFNS